MVLMVFVALMALTVMVMNQGKIRQDVSAKLRADDDIERAISKITSLMLSPPNCTATLYHAPLNGSLNVDQGTLAGIKKCPLGSKCNTPATIPTTYYIPASLTAPTPWNETTTGLSSKVRVVSIHYAQTRAQSDGITSHNTPAIITLTILLEKKLGIRKDAVYTRNVTRKVEVFASVWPNTTPDHISGCTKSPDSLITY